MRQQLYRAFRKSPSSRVARGRLREVGRIRPSADGQQDLEFPVPLLEQEQLLDAAVHIVSRIVPRIRRIMLLLVRKAIGEIPTRYPDKPLSR